MPRFGILLSLVLLGASLATATRPARAAVKEFPYEAVVEADETYVRCGPGKNFYTTIKLTRGQHVTVRRHDPGGWFMIDPPAGSFSLVRVEDVVQEGNIATVKRLEQGQACVRIGSTVDPTNDSIFQRKLSTGERAEILGEVMIPRKDRTVPMFRIRPPRGEFRWIEGNDLAPLDPQIKQQQDNDPFTTPPRTHEARNDQNRQSPPTANATTIALSTTTPSTPSTPTNSINGATSRASGQPGKGKSGAGATTTAQKGKTSATQQVVIGPTNFDPRGRLDQIDVEFRDMIQKDPPAWDLGQIEQAYLELKQNPAAAGVANQVDLRFSALSHYKQVKAEYDDYYRLVSNTSRRDAELAAVENSLAPQNSRPAIGPAPQEAVATTTPGDANFRQQTPAPNGLPTLSMPGYGNQPNAASQLSVDGQQSSQSQYPQAQYPQGQYSQAQVGQQQFPPAQQTQPSQFESSPQPSAGSPSTPQDSLPQFSQQPAPTQHEQRHGPVLGAPVPVPLENQPPASGGFDRSLEQPANAGESMSPGRNNTGNSPGVGEMSTGAGSMPPAPAQQPPMQQAPLQLSPTQQLPTQQNQPQQMRTYTSQFGPNPGAPGNPGTPGQMYSAYPGAPGSQGAPAQVSPTAPFTLTPTQPGAMPMGPANGTANQPYAPQNMGYPRQYPPTENAQPFAAQQRDMPQSMPQQMPQQMPQPMPSQQPGMPQAIPSQGMAPQGGSPQNAVPQGGFPPNGISAGTPQLAAPRQIRPPGSPPLDGAGIVQRAATTSPNGPRHVLLAPNGRILAYLQADRGVNLDAFVGRSMGIMGTRAYQADLQTDLIVVHGMVPVRLAQP
jgi:hypothetical protein